jgi:hypothetical protein
MERRPTDLCKEPIPENLLVDTDGANPSHLTEEDVVAYLGNELTDNSLRRVEQHLARCAECRDEIVETWEILRRPRRSRGLFMAPLAAAAAALVLFVWVGNDGTTSETHRDPPTAPVVAPSPIAPIGTATTVSDMVWSKVASADNYRLTLFDAEGLVVWRVATTDTQLALPDSVELQPGRVYLWTIEGRVGFDVWESSALTEFQVQGPAPPVGAGGSLEP